MGAQKEKVLQKKKSQTHARQTASRILLLYTIIYIHASTVFVEGGPARTGSKPAAYH